MIKLENKEIVGLEAAIRGMRNPMNSWDRSDSASCENFTCDDCPLNGTKTCETNDYFAIGPNDHDLMMRLAKGGPVHAKYRRMIVVYVDITAPLYWWKEFDTYKVGTVANSCSTMHKIHDKEFVWEDFSTEHLVGLHTGELLDTELLMDVSPFKDGSVLFSPVGILDYTISMLNICREKFLETKKRIKNAADADEEKQLKELAKKYWWQMIQLLPSSYNQKRTVMLSYEVLANIYKWRKNHKLDEWREFCEWIEKLPYSEVITGEVEENEH